MKIKNLLFSTLSILLASCSLKISVIDESYDKGLSHEEKIYEFYEGDNLNLSLYNSYDIIIPKNKGESDFIGHNEINEETNETISITPGEEIIDFLGPQDTILNSIINPQYIGSDNRGLKIGYIASYIDGQITFRFNKEIAAVCIKASPRAVLVTDKYGTKMQIDQETGISVNNSKYILLNSEFNEIESITDTTCSYLLNSSSSDVSISVGKFRAIISSITVYTIK